MGAVQGSGCWGDSMGAVQGSGCWRGSVGAVQVSGCWGFSGCCAGCWGVQCNGGPMIPFHVWPRGALGHLHGAAAAWGQPWHPPRCPTGCCHGGAVTPALGVLGEFPRTAVPWRGGPTPGLGPIASPTEAGPSPAHPWPWGLVTSPTAFRSITLSFSSTSSSSGHPSAPQGPHTVSGEQQLLPTPRHAPTPRAARAAAAGLWEVHPRVR